MWTLLIQWLENTKNQTRKKRTTFVLKEKTKTLIQPRMAEYKSGSFNETETDQNFKTVSKINKDKQQEDNLDVVTNDAIKLQEVGDTFLKVEQSFVAGVDQK